MIPQAIRGAVIAVRLRQGVIPLEFAGQPELTPLPGEARKPVGLPTMRTLYAKEVHDGPMEIL